MKKQGAKKNHEATLVTSRSVKTKLQYPSFPMHCSFQYHRHREWTLQSEKNLDFGWIGDVIPRVLESCKQQVDQFYEDTELSALKISDHREASGRVWRVLCNLSKSVVVSKRFLSGRCLCSRTLSLSGQKFLFRAPSHMPPCPWTRKRSLCRAATLYLSLLAVRFLC